MGEASSFKENLKLGGLSVGKDTSPGDLRELRRALRVCKVTVTLVGEM